MAATQTAPVEFSAAAVQQQAEPVSTAATMASIVSAPPYAQFVLFALTSEIMFSVVVFNIADDTARGRWHSTLSATVAGTVCVLLFTQALRVWNKLKGASIAEDASVRRKKLLSRTIVFGVLFSATAGFVGSAIGTSGAETNQFNADVDEASKLVDRITHARTSAAFTLSAQIKMYKSIEGDVQKWNSALRRLRDEMDVYDRKYPAQHADSAKAIHSFEVGLKRADLLRRQVEVAKEIELLDPSAQLNDWQTRMQPLLDQENGLEKAK